MIVFLIINNISRPADEDYAIDLTDQRGREILAKGVMEEVNS